MTRPVDICNNINRFFYQCLEDGVIEAFQNHKTDYSSTNQFFGPVTSIKMISSNGVTFKEYISILDENSYSAVFSDASIISIQCVFEQNIIKAHRYMYIPCPVGVKLLKNRRSDIPLADWLRCADSNDLPSTYHSSGYMRFDYSTDIPKNNDDPHPISHLTFGSPTCRIPVKAPLSPSGFLEFIFENFYRYYQKKWRRFEPHLRCRELDDTISTSEAAKHHFNWN